MATRTIGGQSLNVTKTPKSLVYTLAELVNDLVAAVNELRTDSNAIGSVILTSPALALGSTNTNVATGVFLYTVSGTMYYKAAVTAGTAPGTGTIGSGNFGAVAFDISTDGTIDARVCTGVTTGYTNATLAIAALPTASASHVRMGYITIRNTAAFTLGDAHLTLSSATVTYVSTTPTPLPVISAAAVDDISLRELGAP